MKVTNRKKAIFQKKGNTVDDNIVRLMIPSMIGIVLCVVLLMGVTWAWFTASVETKSTLCSAKYDLDINITDESGTAVEEANGSYALDAGKKYKVTLTASGTSTSSGYCIVNGGGKELKTVQIGKGNALSFTLTPNSSGTYKFIPVWGTYSGNADITADSSIDNNFTASDNSGASNQMHDNMNSDVNKPQADGEGEHKEQTNVDNSNAEIQQNITEEPLSDVSK